MTEPTSYVEQQVQQRIQAAKVRVAAARERRTSLAEARRHGLARRHAAKLRNLKDTERADARLEESGDAED
ncbi:hypothetical protein [Streptomyces scabiei]|uniref:hypothetical protein n=1 Tax=Streptomyces scabiei TaxID=1930 RepID=UPI0029BF8956|nr:hypothetical protein [Streptomyces scabiei]MDX3279096.1 hypothetical protein [Streptomyces scabiei]